MTGGKPLAAVLVLLFRSVEASGRRAQDRRRASSPGHRPQHLPGGRADGV